MDVETATGIAGAGVTTILRVPDHANLLRNPPYPATRNVRSRAAGAAATADGSFAPQADIGVASETGHSGG
jgi:hypothetical protein